MRNKNTLINKKRQVTWSSYYRTAVYTYIFWVNVWVTFGLGGQYNSSKTRESICFIFAESAKHGKNKTINNVKL